MRVVTVIWQSVVWKKKINIYVRVDHAVHLIIV